MAYWGPAENHDRSRMRRSISAATEGPKQGKTTPLMTTTATTISKRLSSPKSHRARSFSSHMMTAQVAVVAFVFMTAAKVAGKPGACAKTNVARYR